VLHLAPLSNTPLQLSRLPSRHPLGVAFGQPALQPRPARRRAAQLSGKPLGRTFLRASFGSRLRGS
jgi:hypothetical protein